MIPGKETETAEKQPNLMQGEIMKNSLNEETDSHIPEKV